MLLSLAFALTACVETNQKRGVGFDAYDAAPHATAGTVTRPSQTETVTVTEASNGQVRTTYQLGNPPGASGGSAVEGRRMQWSVPLFVTTSLAYRNGGRPQPPEAAAWTAYSFLSSQWGPGYSVPFEFVRLTGRLRLVTVDGRTFGVLRDIKMPIFGVRPPGGNLGTAVAQEIGRLSGCRPNGVIVQRSGKYYELQGYAVGLTC